MSDALQEKYLELRTLENHIKKLQKQMETSINQNARLQEIVDNFEELKKVKEDSKILTTLAPGIFIKAKIQSPQKVLLGVGEGIVVEKDLDSAKEIIQKEITELERIISELKEEIVAGTNQLYALQEEVNKMSPKQA